MILILNFFVRSVCRSYVIRNSKIFILKELFYFNRKKSLFFVVKRYLEASNSIIYYHMSKIYQYCDPQALHRFVSLYTYVQVHNYYYAILYDLLLSYIIYSKNIPKYFIYYKLIIIVDLFLLHNVGLK